MYKEILKNIRTARDVLRAKEEIDLLLDSLYKSDTEAYDTTLKKHVRQWFSELVQNQINKNKVDKEKFLKGLGKKLDEMRRVKLTIAYEPTQNMVDGISDWIKERVGEDVVVEFSYNPGVLAGAVVVYKGEYRDFSLRKKLDLYFETNHTNILQNLSK